ncbi:hypothetical protein B7463_g8580, partial [Scytalidium lignicola]
MGPPKQAQFVCQACNVRKKACDKELPACGYCASHNLSCQYDSNKKRHRPYNPGKNFVPVETLYPSNELKTEQLIQHHDLSDSSPLPQWLLSTPSQAINESVNQQVLNIIRRVDLSPDRISDHYFRTFHCWYPIISPELFYRATSQYRNAGTPPADLSILILAMCLITTVHNLGKSSQPPSFVQECLYYNTKSLFALAQAELCTSLNLVQAAFLIAACEYICVRPEAAYISISACSSLARVLGVTKESLGPAAARRRTTGLELTELERMNVAWAIPMLERIILAEINQKGILSQTEYPDLDSLPPSDLPLIQSQDLRLFPDRSICDSSNSSDPQDTSICRFGWQAQAVSLLDQVLHTIRSTSQCRVITLPELTELDRKIRSFLVVAISEENKKFTSSTCSAVALCIRSLFLLHQHILVVLAITQNESDHRARCFSQAAVNTACEMVVDAVRCVGNQKRADASPICCYYNLCCALQYLQERQRSLGNETLSADVECLVSAQEAYHNRWTSLYR